MDHQDLIASATKKGIGAFLYAVLSLKPSAKNVWMVEQAARVVLSGNPEAFLFLYKSKVIDQELALGALMKLVTRGRDQMSPMNVNATQRIQGAVNCGLISINQAKTIMESLVDKEYYKFIATVLE